MEPSRIDVAVLLIFFSRPRQLGQVFEQVRTARPSRLYLYQDGPRLGRPGDADGIRRCREIVGDIDWECEVHTLFQPENVGCDPSEYVAQKWMFETEEMGIILEDDDVPSLSFFPFCKDLLEKYRHDERIDRICGMNNTGVSEHIDSSYLFANTGSVWGWATWKRVLDTWDPSYSWLDDEPAVRQLRDACDTAREYKAFLNMARMHKATGLPHYETVGGFALYAQSRLLVVPKYNLISNVGASGESTHSSEMRLIPRRVRRLFLMKRYEIEFPLKHPRYVIRDRSFEKETIRTRTPRFVDRIERLFLLVRHGEFSRIFKKLRGLRSERPPSAS